MRHLVNSFYERMEALCYTGILEVLIESRWQEYLCLACSRNLELLRTCNQILVMHYHLVRSCT